MKVTNKFSSAGSAISLAVTTVLTLLIKGLAQTWSLLTILQVVASVENAKILYKSNKDAAI